MSDPWKADEPIKEENIINESERDSANPENDEYKLVKLESDGRLSPEFVSLGPLFIFEYDTPGAFVWTKPNEGTFALVELWGGGASGGLALSTTANIGFTAKGGTGGGYRRFWVPLSVLGATVDGVVGAGGVARSGTPIFTQDGQNGGVTTFQNISVVGGVGGIARSTTADMGNRQTAGTVGVFGENGGDGGGATANRNGISVLFSSPGGGGAQASTGSGVGGEGALLSTKAGDGFHANSGSGSGGNGDSPGCGGGACAIGNASGTSTSGAGGNGFVRITVF